MLFRQQRQRLLKKFYRAAGRAAVATAQPPVQQKMRFRQHRHQGMMRGPSMLARVGPTQRALLPAVALEHGRVQIQTVSGRGFRQSLQLPVPQAGEKTLALSLAETFEQIANRVVDWKASDP